MVDGNGAVHDYLDYCTAHARIDTKVPTIGGEGRSTRAAPRGSLHGGVADLFYTDVRSILMVL